MDFLTEIREEMIKNFQISLRAIRLLMGYSAAELAMYVGVTRQTINNLETGRAKMSPMQFIALSAVVDYYSMSNGEMFQAIEAIIDGNYRKSGRSYDTSFSNLSLLRRWFDSFDNATAQIAWTDSAGKHDLTLNILIGNYKLFLDTGVLLSDGAEQFVEDLEKKLSKEKATVIVPLRAVEQIQMMTQNTETAKSAMRALKLIGFLQGKSLVEIRGEENDRSPQETITAAFEKFRFAHRLCLITQDAAFAERITEFNRMQGVLGYAILAGYIDESGRVILYPDSYVCKTDTESDTNESEVEKNPDSFPDGDCKSESV